MSSQEPADTGEDGMLFAEVSNLEPAQVTNPWRATIRTIIQQVPGVAVAVPLIVDAIYNGNSAAAGPIALGAVAFSGIIARVMAVKKVNDLLTQWGLGAYPKDQPMLTDVLDDNTR